VGSTDAHAGALARELRARLAERRRADAAAGRLPQPGLARAVEELVEAEAAVLSPARRAELRELIMRETVGLGPLEVLLADPAVEDVLVNGPTDVFVERRGRVERTGVRFESEAALRDAIERILAPLGRRVDELSPMADARLAEGRRTAARRP
jgi:pilus assembly protein CpaF